MKERETDARLAVSSQADPEDPVMDGVMSYLERLVTPDYLDNRGLYWGAEDSLPDDYIPYLRSGLQVQWTFSRSCNFSCVHCFNDSSPSWRGMEADPLRVADAIIEAKPFNVCMCGGEPLAWKPVYEVIEKLRSSGIPLASTVTNGYLATPNRIRRLHESGLTHLQISLDGITNEQFVQLRLKPDGLEKASAAVDCALQYEWGDFSVSFTPTRHNIESWPDFCRHWASRGVKHIRTQPFMPIGRGRYSKDLVPSDEQYQKFHLEMFDLNAELQGCHVDWGDPIEHIWFFTRTEATAHSYGIQTDGWFELSCYIPVLVGSSLEHSAEELWQLDIKRLWNAPIMRRFADKLTDLGSMSEIELEIYREDSLHIDVFQEDQLEVFLTSDDLELLKEISRKNIAAYRRRWAA